ncbi:MAG: integration host factor subunit alpha [Desulfobacterales bacterium]|nr:integration host factor subunit alpha [Desulfobacterales bacterium]
MSLTKADIIDAVRTNLGHSKAQSAKLVESLLEIMKRTMANGEDVLISGFGKFCVNEKKERRGRNPQTKEDMMLRPRRVVTFKCSGVLRDRINGEGTGSR